MSNANSTAKTKTRFVVTAIQCDGQRDDVAVRVNIEKAADAVVKQMSSLIRELEETFRIEWEELLTDPEKNALRSAIANDRRLVLVDGACQDVPGIEPARMARLGFMLDRTYEIDAVDA